MTPLRLSQFWQRRVYEVAFLLSIALISLYVVPLFTTIPTTGLFEISLFVVIGAGLTAFISLVSFFIKNEVFGKVMPAVVYLLFAATIGLLIVQTGQANSPFIGVWVLVAFFSGLFAVWGLVPMLLVSGVFVAASYLDGTLTASTVALVSLVSLVPAIISLFVWRSEDGPDESSKNVRKLTSELSEVASKSEIVINAIGDGVVAVDSQGVIQLINPAAQEILGWGKQDSLLLNYKSILQMRDPNGAELDPSQDPIAQVLNTNQQLRSSTLTILTKSGKKMMSSLVVSPIGEPGAGVIAVFRDITKEKAEEREQAEFISTASHEMRTPVASIEGYLGLAVNPNTATIDDRARDFINKAHEAAQHLGRLFQDLLDVSKSEDGRMTNLPRVVDLTAFTETIVQGLQQKAQEKGLTLTFVPSARNGQKTIAPVYFVNQDNDHIREIIDNLVENGIKYTPQGSVTVDISGSDDKVVVSIKDTGLGIPTEDVSHLFQKFYRVDNMDRQSIGGTGLGLYLSRRLAESMQGRLWVESAHGQGSTFFFELPRITSDEAARLKAQQAAQAAVQPVAPPTPATPAMPPVVPPAPSATIQGTQPVAPVASPAAPTPAPTVQPATTVPRGESLTAEQKAARVKQLEDMARAAREPQPRPPQT